MVSFESEGLVTAELREKIRTTLNETVQNGEVFRTYNVQTLTFSREDEKFLEERIQGLGDDYIEDDNLDKREVEEKFKILIFVTYTHDFLAPWENGNDIWLIYNYCNPSNPSELTENTTGVINTFASPIKNSLLPKYGSKDDTYSVGFFTAEVNDEVHVVFIFQRIAKSNTAAPVE